MGTRTVTCEWSGRHIGAGRVDIDHGRDPEYQHWCVGCAADVPVDKIVTPGKRLPIGANVPDYPDAWWIADPKYPDGKIGSWYGGRKVEWRIALHAREQVSPLGS